MAKSIKNSQPKKGMKLHTFIATGGNPKDFKGASKGAVTKKK